MVFGTAEKKKIDVGQAYTLWRLLANRYVYIGHLQQLKNFTHDKDFNILLNDKIRTRKIGNKAIIDMHILVEETMNIKSAHNIASELEIKLKQVFDPSCIVTIHIEPLG